tara:strand:- start:200 stop:1036 length:837 start_codon:yes stop_codon:yes gene_type:complete
MKITNNTNRDMSILTKTLESFIPYTQERLGYDKPFQVFFESDEENSKNIFGKTAYYDPATMNVHVYVDGRHDKDMLRSISHEVVHHHQNCRGDFDGAFEVGEGYAQKSPHLRNMEAEAYLLGNGFLVRDFEDACKAGDMMIAEWVENNKGVLKEMKNKGNVQTLEKNVSFTKLVALAQKLKIDDAIEVSQLLSSLASSLGIDPATLPKLLVRLKADYTSDAKEAGIGQEAPAAEQPPVQEQELEPVQEKEVTIRDYYADRSNTVNEEIMKKWFKKGNK